MIIAGGDVCVSAEKDEVARHFRGIIVIEKMAVCCEYGSSADIKQGIIRHYGKIENHLINLAVTVSANADDAFFYSVEHCGDFSCVVSAGDIVSRTVIEQISEENELIRLLGVVRLNELFAKQSRPVNIGGNHKLHINILTFGL